MWCQYCKDYSFFVQQCCCCHVMLALRSTSVPDPINNFIDVDTEPYTAMIYAVWMLHIADFYDFFQFYDQWWGLLAVWTGHYHGMKFSTSGMGAFGASPRKPRPNHGRKFVYDTVHRWIKRLMAWHPEGHKRIGRQKYRWDAMIENFPT